ncbi:ZCCHC9 [Mytilus coruscus]|uniref:ZCCHC9 n=1 Tax=Mytilus coruscus TaxID=42192 RepID=A0A6J8EL36_MYTCO|nr:ZCCHC9 [Mytilus coruscus]
MAESPDLEIRFRSEEREKEARHERNTEFADANETLEEHRANVYAHGEGDVNREYGMSGQRGQRGINTDGFRYNNLHTVCAELGRWQHADKVLALAAALRGAARTFYISLEQTEKRDYGILTQRLGLRFGSTRQQNRWLSRLEMRKRNPGESIAALADDLRQMAQRAYIDLDARAQEVLAFSQLYKRAVEVIERYEAIIGDGSDKKKGSVRMTTDTHLGEASKFSQEPPENQFQDRINGLTRRISQLEGTKQNNSNSWQNNNNRRPQWGNTNNKQAKCFICESISHLCRYCPFYLRYKQENARHGNAGGQQGSKD